MSNPIPGYDGSRPEPPYKTASEIEEALQDELDAMTADRDRLAAELARVRRNHLRSMAKCAYETYKYSCAKGSERLWRLSEACLAELAKIQGPKTERKKL